MGEEIKYVEFEKGDRLEMAVLEFRFAIVLLEGTDGLGRERGTDQTQDGNFRSVSSVISTHPR